MDRRHLCTSLLAATMFVGGSAAFAQQQQPAGADSGAGTSGLTGGAPAGTSGATSDQSGAAAQAGARYGQQAGEQMAMETDPDKRFLQMAAVGNMLDVQAAQIAQQKAQSQDVKQLAQHIMDDHQKAQQDIQQTAQKTGVQIPQQLPHMMQNQLQEFSQLQGDEFDKRYVSAIKAAHAAAISKCSDEAKIAKNDDIKQLAQKMLPTLQAHGQMIGQVAQAQGLSMEGLAQPAGATIQPAGTSGGSSGTTGGGTSGSPGTSGTPGAGTSGSETTR